MAWRRTLAGMEPNLETLPCYAKEYCEAIHLTGTDSDSPSPSRSTSSPITRVPVATLAEMTRGARKAADGRVSATDVVMVVKRCTRNSASKMLRQLRDEGRIPELGLAMFGGSASGQTTRGGNRNPEAAADARQIVQVVWALPGDCAFRKNSADVVVRYLGGDPGMIEEIIANRAAQETLAREQPAHPARIFGEAVDSEGLKRKREETDLIESRRNRRRRSSPRRGPRPRRCRSSLT